MVILYTIEDIGDRHISLQSIVRNSSSHAVLNSAQMIKLDQHL